MKGVSFIEQHVEKIVVAVLAIVLVAVLAMQFLMAPNRVAMGGEEVDPGDIHGKLKDKAKVINESLGGRQAAPLVPEGIPKVADDFLAGLDRPVSPRGTLPRIDNALATALIPENVTSGDAEFHVPLFPPLQMLEVRQESATITESAVAANKELGELLSASGEVDVTWSIPVARIDLKGIRSELRASRDGRTPIPEVWTNNGTLYLVDLVFERQELGEEGWGESITIPPLPGNFSLRKELGNADAILRDEVFRLLGSRERALAILQPDFYQTVREVFSPGAILGDTGDQPAGESDEVRRARRTLAAKSANLARIEADLKDLGGPLRGADEKDKKKSDADGDGGSGGGSGTKTPGSGMGFGSGTAGGKRGMSGSTPDDEATRSKRRLLTAQFDRLTADVNRLSGQLEKLSPGGLPVAKGTGGTDLLKADSLLVWGHDLGVKPGSTYRYRARLELYNPFFARKRQLSAKQAALADAFTLRTDVSDWSEPVAIEPDVAFFLVDAGPGEGRLGLGSAKFEVFRYVDGERRRETFAVQPGERIGDARETGKDRHEVDFGTDWFVVDVLEGLPGDGRGDGKARNARVLVADDRGRTMVRTAVSDFGNALRRKFNDEVEDARLDASAPAAPPDAPSGSSAPPMTPAGGPGTPTPK